MLNQKEKLNKAQEQSSTKDLKQALTTPTAEASKKP